MIPEDYIKKAISQIKSKNLKEAKKYIHLAMCEKDSSPEPDNLLGIVSEINGDLSLSARYYRAAYSLDPAFKPVSRNLERITSCNYIFDLKNIDYGDSKNF